MDWFRVDRGMTRHGKVKRLAKALGVLPREAVGLVVEFWDWLADQYEDREFTREDFLGEWDDVTLQGMLKAEWIDQLADGVTLLGHDWKECQSCYFGSRKRVAKHREKKKTKCVTLPNVTEPHGNVTVTGLQGVQEGKGGKETTDFVPPAPSGGGNDSGSFHQHPSPEDNGFDSAIRVLEQYARFERAFAGGKQILQTVRGFVKRLEHEGRTSEEIKQEGKRLMDAAVPGMKIWDVLQPPEAKKKMTRFEEVRERINKENRSAPNPE